MDELDRLYVEFVEIMRRDRPSALTDPLGVADLCDQIIPYRKVRDAAGLRSNDDYEVALTRLLSGERGYLSGDRAMQEELRAGLEEKLPDIRRYRAFADKQVSLNPALIPPPGNIRYAPPELRERADELDTPTTPTEGEATASLEVSTTAENEAGISESQSEDAEFGHVGPLPEEAAELEDCPSCSAEVPAGSSYCPFCGARVVPGVCVGCGAELDPTWIFCPECGRQREDRTVDSS